MLLFIPHILLLILQLAAASFPPSFSTTANRHKSCAAFLSVSKNSRRAPIDKASGTLGVTKTNAKIMTPRKQQSIILSSSRNHDVDTEILQDSRYSNDDNTIPSYSIANFDLSNAWFNLVKDNKVSATTTIKDAKNNDGEIFVRYGVRITKKKTTTNNQNDEKQQEITRLEEFVEQVFSEERDKKEMPHPLVERINATLSSLQSSFSSAAIRYIRNGPFVAQLQLVRTLRPPPSPGFGTNAGDTTTTSSTPPPYNADTDSFVVGPLRLQLRPLLTTLHHLYLDENDNNHKSTTTTTTKTPWDIYHNVSPADARGHFLLLPTLSHNYKDFNWREQRLTNNDCHDLVHLTSTIAPFGSMLVSYNSVAAGASQNHVHCHVWPCPPLPLLESLNENDDKDKDDGNDETNDDDGKSGWECYAASQVTEIEDFVDLWDGKVEVTFLSYPCMCIMLSSSSSMEDGDENEEQSQDTSTKSSPYTLLGEALAKTLDVIGDAPHNVCMLNRPVYTYDDMSLDKDGPLFVEDEINSEKNVAATSTKTTEAGAAAQSQSDVDVYIFIRSKERSPNVVPGHKLGASEMMGFFHARSGEEMDELSLVDDKEEEESNDMEQEDEDDDDDEEDHEHDEGMQKGPMARALRDVSYEPRGEMWDRIKEELIKLSIGD